jgi:hypothetical protein
MRNSHSLAVVFVALSFSVIPSYGYGLREIFGCARHDACGCGCEADCGCEPACASEPACGCGADCGCEPACGCGSGCGINGRQFAGQTWNCGEKCDGPPICPCTGPDGSCQGGCCAPAGECGECCEPACGCGQCGECCEPACGCEPGCGCGDACRDCDNSSCCLKRCGFGSWIGHVLGAVCKPCGCNGCDSEMYWCEWHNDPPQCCDPCDRCGNWIGPGAGYRAPYDHPYAPSEYTDGAYANSAAPKRATAVARNMPVQQRGQIARQRSAPAHETYRR